MKTTLFIIVQIFIFSYLSFANEFPKDNCITCEQDDYTALRALYLSTKGDFWDIKTGWPDENFFLANVTMPAGTDVSTWHGVSMVGLCVRILSLSSNSLVGTIPPELELMPFLIRLNLSDNKLEGSIPAELGKIPNIQSVNLGDNMLSGNIPTPQTGDYSKLKGFVALRNALTGNIPSYFGNIQTLESILLSDNQLTGPIPAKFGDLDNLRTLWLSFNMLTGPIPGELGNLSNLTSLLLSHNQLTGCYDPNLMNLCSQLTTNSNSQISNGNLLEADWEAFCLQGPNACTPCLQDDYIALRALFLSTKGSMWSNSSGWPSENLFLMPAYATVPPPGFEDLNQWFGVTTNTDGCVTHLFLNNNNLDGHIPIEIGNLGNLIVLEAKLNLLVGSIPTSIENLTNLIHLDLGANDLSGSLPEELGCLQSIKKIYLYSNLFTGCIPPKLATPANLTHLGLNNNQLSGGIPLEFGDSNSLIYLNVAHNKLSGCFDDNLSNLCTQLASIYSTDQYITRNNNFFATWQTFCSQGSSACLSCVDVGTFPSPTNGDMVVTGPVTELVAQRNREIIQEAIDAANAASTCISFPTCGMIWIDYPLETESDYINLDIDPDGLPNWDDNNYIPMLHFENFGNQIYFNQCTLKINYFDLFQEYRNQLMLRLEAVENNQVKLLNNSVVLDDCTPDNIWEDDSANLCETCPVCLEINPAYFGGTGVEFFTIVKEVAAEVNDKLMAVVVVEQDVINGVSADLTNFLFKDLVIEALDGLADIPENESKNLADDTFIFSYDCSGYNNALCNAYQTLFNLYTPPTTAEKLAAENLLRGFWIDPTLALPWHHFLTGVLFNSGNWTSRPYSNAMQSVYPNRALTAQTGLAAARSAAHVSGITVTGLNEGVAVYHARDLVLADINAKNFTDTGFSLIYSNDCSLLYSEIAGGGDGNLNVSWGSANNNVFSSSIHGLKRKGQLISIENSSDNTVDNCIIYDGFQGVDIKRTSERNIIQNNIFTDNHVSVILRSTDRQGEALDEIPTGNMILNNSISPYPQPRFGPTPAAINLLNSSNTTIDGNDFNLEIEYSNGNTGCIYGILLNTDNNWMTTHPSTTISNNHFQCYENHVVSLPNCDNIPCKPIDNLQIINNKKAGACDQADPFADYRLDGIHLADAIISNNNQDCNSIMLEISLLKNQGLAEIDLQGQINYEITADACPMWPITLVSGSIGGSIIYDQKIQIESDATITMGSDYTFKASECILLNNNFTVKSNTMFLAEIEKCIE